MAGHEEGQRSAAATWGRARPEGEASHQGPGKPSEPGIEQGFCSDSDQRHLASAPLTCPRRWRSRKARQRHCLGRPRLWLCAPCMFRLSRVALTRLFQVGDWLRSPRSSSGSPRPAPQRRFYSALLGRAQAGWLPLRQEAGDRRGGEWNEPRGCHSNWPWVPLSSGRGPGACVCLCVATGFSQSSGRGWVEARGQDPELAERVGRKRPFPPGSGCAFPQD